MIQQLVDATPIGVATILIVIVAFVSYEIGFQGGRWWQRRTPDEVKGPTTLLVGSLLTLMAFLLAITTGMANDRFDARRTLVVAEANAISTTYLRAGYLPVPAGDETKRLLREYIPLRINTHDQALQQSNFQRSTEIHDELWAIAEEVARAMPDSPLVAIYIESLNELIDLHTTRVTALLTARVPETLFLLLIVGSLVSLGMIGYSAGLTGRRGLVAEVGLVIVLSAVMTLVIDLDRPRDGYLQVSQQPLIELQQSLGSAGQ